MYRIFKKLKKMIHFAFWWVNFNSCWMKMDPVHKVSEFYKYMSSYFVTFVTHSYLCQQKVKILIDYIICNICWFNLILGRVWFLLTFEFLTLAEFMESFIFSKNKQICEILATVQKKRPKEIQKRFKQNCMAEVI